MSLVMAFIKLPVVMNFPPIPIDAFKLCGYVMDFRFKLIPGYLGTASGMLLYAAGMDRFSRRIPMKSFPRPLSSFGALVVTTVGARSLHCVSVGGVRRGKYGRAIPRGHQGSGYTGHVLH